MANLRVVITGQCDGQSEGLTQALLERGLAPVFAIDAEVGVEMIAANRAQVMVMYNTPGTEDPVALVYPDFVANPGGSPRFIILTDRLDSSSLNALGNSVVLPLRSNIEAVCHAIDGIVMKMAA